MNSLLEKPLKKWPVYEPDEIPSEDELLKRLVEDTMYDIEEHMVEKVDHPPHYGGGDNPYEVIKVLEAWDLGFHLGNAVKYVARAGRKNKNTEMEDIRKAIWYLERYLMGRD